VLVGDCRASYTEARRKRIDYLAQPIPNKNLWFDIHAIP
jgi:hypothetical protein